MSTIASVIGFGRKLSSGHSGIVVVCTCGNVRLAEPGKSKGNQCKCKPQERDIGWGVERKCKRCHEWWMLDQFEARNRAGHHGGRLTVCLACIRERKNSRRRKTP